MKAQIQMAPIYILGSVIIVLIFIFGYKAISELKQKETQFTSFSMTAKFKNDVKSIGSEFGTVKTISYSVPNDVNEVCFYSNANPLICSGSCAKSSNENLARAFINDNKANKNMFFFGNSGIKGSEFIEGVELNCCGDYMCVKNVNNKVDIRIEGKGNKALIKDI